MQDLSPQQLEGFKLMFAQMDKNGDGTVVKSELDQVFKFPGGGFSDEQIQEYLQAHDLNGDGQITFDEFIQHVQAMLSQFAQPAPQQ